MRVITILFFLLHGLKIFAVDPQEYVQEHQNLVTSYFNAMYKQPFVGIVSYPHSGSTFLRYCIEALTKRPTLEYRHNKLERFNIPLGITFDHLNINLHANPIWKVHDIRSITNQDFFNKDAKLILLLRNYRENILRWYKVLKVKLLVGKRINTSYVMGVLEEYFNNLRVFDAFPDDKKLLVYYEDLISSPRETLEKVLKFLDTSNDCIDKFFDEYESHVSNAFSIHPICVSKGKDNLFYSKEFGTDICKQLDGLIGSSFPRLYEKYLIRYKSA